MGHHIDPGRRLASIQRVGNVPPGGLCGRDDLGSRGSCVHLLGSSCPPRLTPLYARLGGLVSIRVLVQCH